MNKVIEEAEKISTDFINSNNKFIETGDPFVKYIASHKGLASFGRPNVTVHIKKEKSADSLMYPNSVVFEATYNFDEQGRRKTSVTFGDKDSYGIFFGDAHCFGEGLNDNETLPYFFEKYNSNYVSLNYGFLGHGPNHMLYWLNTPEFIEEFKDTKGKVFFVYRDDAIKVSVGEVPWGEGYPKYNIQNGKIKYEGSYGGDNYKPNNMYLPSMFTNKDFNITSEILLECKNKLKEISKDLELYIIIIPLSFSNYQIQPLLESKDINVVNLYTTDLEYHTKADARFLDGVHTKHSNELIVKLVNTHIKGNLTNVDNSHKDYNSLQELEKRLDLEAMYIPCMVDFPYDDAGVIISNVLKSYKGVPVKYDYLLKYLEKEHTKKLKRVTT